MFRKFTNRFGVVQLVLITLLAATGIAVKAVIVPLVHLVTSALFIPGGVVAGGIYMLFLVLARALCKVHGAGFLTGLLQAVMVMVAGFSGSHGILSLVTYAMPGLAVDLVYLVFKNREQMLVCVLGGIAANMTGSLLVNSVFFNLPFIPLMLTVSLGGLSGALGGVIAWQIKERVEKLGVL